MSVCVLDYLTISIIPKKELENCSVISVLNLIASNFYLDSYLDKFRLVGRARHYAAVYRFNDISIKVPAEDRLYKQGVCVECTSNGLAHLVCKLPKDVTLRDVLRSVRAMSYCGYKVNAPRVDIALDDIARGTDKPILHLNTIYRKWLKHEFCSLSRPSNRDIGADFVAGDGGFFKNGKVSENLKKGVFGRTIYFGNRKSSVCVRFYDKLAEKIQNKEKVDGKINSWVRCEYEFHNAKAMSIINLYIDNDFPDFVRLYKRTVMGHLRFINQSEKNRSRCPTCAWWIAFLDSVEARPLATAPVRSAQFKRSYDWAFNKCAPTLWGLMACMGTVDFIIALKEYGRNNIKARQIQLLEDYLDNNNDLADECENMWAFMMAMYDYDDYESALRQLKEDSFYIRNMPADCDSREWIQSVFANGAVSCV